MNANELINKLKLVRCIAGDGQILNEAETMLRQQQAEIEALKQQLVTTSSEAKLNYNKGHEDGRQLGIKQEQAFWELAASTQEIMDTHPVKEELTDEEIHQAIRRGFARDGFLSDGIFLEIKELLRNTQGVNSEQVPDFFFMENDLMGKR
jgi:hypothetical protein